MLTEDEARRLQAATGVDFMNLRQKYLGAGATAAPKADPPCQRGHNGTQQQQHEGRRTGAEETAAAGAEGAHARADAAGAALDKYAICMQCGGLGIRKELYNHMVLERSCEACEGDGIAPRK